MIVGIKRENVPDREYENWYHQWRIDSLEYVIWHIMDLWDEWINISDQYPRDWVDVLVYSKWTMCVDNCKVLNYRIYKNWFSKDSEVTHWMPLPLPPKQ